MSNVLCFYHEYEENGCMSNWYHAEFEYAGIRYPSTEHFMMYHKASVFGEKELADKILACNTASKAKQYGKSYMPKFNKDLWKEVSYTIVKRGIRAKFSQNTDIREKLLATGNRVLAEASGKDLIWGIGVAIDDPNAVNTAFWKGDNYLGRILMEVREELSKNSEFDYIDAKDLSFAEWKMTASELLHMPKYHATVNAYLKFVPTTDQKAFLYGSSLSEYEKKLCTNGNVPYGFRELKQDIYDLSRL